MKEELYQRGKLTKEQENLIKQFPKGMHPMTQLSMGVLACQTEARFPHTHKDVPKDVYWESTLEDCLDVCAKVSRIAAIVFHNCYKDVRH